VVQAAAAVGDLTAPSGRAAFSLAGQALYLDGEDDQVEVDLPPLPETSDFSVEVWFKSSGPLVGDATLVELVQVFRVFFTKTGGVSLAVHTQDADFPLTVHSPPTTLNDGAWHHVAGAWTHLTKTATLYVDGVQSGEESFGGVDGRGGLLPLSTLLFVGRAYSDTAASFFNGFVDDVRLWRKALSASHVASYMNTALAATEPGLLVYYPFDQKDTYAGSTITDATAGGYDGVFNGGEEDPILVSSTAPLFMLTQTTVEDVPLMIPLAGADVDFDALQFVITTLPVHGTLHTAAGAAIAVVPFSLGAASTVTYVNAPHYFGEDAFGFVTKDAALRTAEGTVRVLVTPLSDAPIGKPLAMVRAPVDALTPIVLEAMDGDRFDNVTFTISTLPAFGLLWSTSDGVTPVSLSFQPLNFKDSVETKPSCRPY
jgi:hypothetical protein